jgi:hypothetical protein
MQVLIPTRNNHAGLSGCLSSLLSVRFQGTGEGRVKDHLILIDSSDSPVICDKHLSRLLTEFCLVYIHTEPHVNRQRLRGLAECSMKQPVLVLDDDIVLLDTPEAVFKECIHTGDTFFGVLADGFNDKHYPDYSRYSKTPSIHSFSGPCNVPFPCLPEHSSPGFMVTMPERAAEVLGALNAAYETQPAIADDAWARVLAGKNPTVHPRLKGLHVGNSSNWWAGNRYKHAAVKAAVDGYNNAQK